MKELLKSGCFWMLMYIFACSTLVILKSVEIVTWRWLYVLSPIYFPIAIVVSIIFAAALDDRPPTYEERKEWERMTRYK